MITSLQNLLLYEELPSYFMLSYKIQFRKVHWPHTMLAPHGPGH